MERDEAVTQLKVVLRREVALFCYLGEQKWKEPIARTIEEIKDLEWRAVFFGGMLRSLLISRLLYHQLGKPRDIDIVVQGVSLEDLRERFRPAIARDTRFGGLQIRRRMWQFDLWPLERTWAFSSNGAAAPQFSDLPFTTFFNLEAIAVDVWPQRHHPRAIYSGDDQFFKGIMERILELNREENPYPTLGVVRALLLAASLNFRLGHRLSKYIADIGTTMPELEFEELQVKHYGRVLRRGRTLKLWTYSVARNLRHHPSQPITLPSPGQLGLWPDLLETPGIHVRLHSIRQRGGQRVAKGEAQTGGLKQRPLWDPDQY